MSILFTIYCILGIIFGGVVVVQLAFDNVWRPFHKRCAIIFPLHTVIVLMICFVSYWAASKFNGGK
ncbi:hypothetical protein VP14_077 [Vibrio phage VPMCC14]|nr:hypothetical protein VP14_077 [Vibrio phage VPMCC14]